MNTLNLHKTKKSRAQAMVEFALVLPILLLLLYGILETGRFLFIYGSTITAARQAVRYGSTTGTIDGTPNGTPYYNDCDGIRAAANRTAFINTFQNIDIKYDTVDDTTATPSGSACGSFTPDGNKSRIIVTVTTEWFPIVGIVPLMERSVAKGNPIISRSERTILGSVNVYVDAGPEDWGGSLDGRADLDNIVASPETYSAVGQVINFTYNLHNGGASDLISPTMVSLTPNTITIDCSANIAPIPAGQTFTCVSTYTITLADLNNGSLTHTAYPTGWANDSYTLVVNANSQPAISLVKTASPAATSIIGNIINYTYTITNTGNVTLQPPFAIEDDKLTGSTVPGDSLSCSGAIAIAPGASTTCSGTHTVSDQDVANRSIVNNATASVVYNSVTVTSNATSFTVNTPPIILSVTQPVNVIAPGLITYNITLTNETISNATGLTIVDKNGKVVTFVSCPNALSAGSSASCTATYNVTQAEIDAGIPLSSIFEAKATMNSVLETSNLVSIVVGADRTSILTASATATPSANPLILNSTILYTYTLTNSGNVTLVAPIAVTDTKGTVITCADQSDFAITTSRTCTGTYTVKAADVTAGSISTTGTATAKFSDGNLPDPDTISATPINLFTPIFSGDRFSLNITQNKTVVTPADLTLTYKYTITNTGGTVLSRPYTITFGLDYTAVVGVTGGTPIPADVATVNIDSYSACIKGSLNPSESTDCTYTIVFPNTNSSAKLVNTTTAASINGVAVDKVYVNGVLKTAPWALPAATFYNCTSANLTATLGTVTRDRVNWILTNKVGVPLPISNITVNWSGTQSLDSVRLSNTVTTLNRLTLPDRVSPYISGGGSLRTSTNLAAGALSTFQTTFTFDFSGRTTPGGLSATITFASPYGGCTRTYP